MKINTTSIFGLIGSILGVVIVIFLLPVLKEMAWKVLYIGTIFGPFVGLFLGFLLIGFIIFLSLLGVEALGIVGTISLLRGRRSKIHSLYFFFSSGITFIFACLLIPSLNKSLAAFPYPLTVFTITVCTLLPPIPHLVTAILCLTKEEEGPYKNL
ncbi:hypothetical protein ACFO4N_14990 [Camelliibacillus cellulosilyticus]|uniref:Energy-coupling factor transport system substrate-specific component n=1 Tax=Camelliibacillus cellulosilyticus TaxID=2174486 RepID=A0ABV9GPT6_9BACL